VAGFCEHGNEDSDPINQEEIFLNSSAIIILSERFVLRRGISLLADP
jgi:hypothetical protein